jgi:hypothetical protein
VDNNPQRINIGRSTRFLVSFMDADQTETWTKLISISSGFEADQIIARLEEAGVPVLVDRGTTGILGPGFAGHSAAGATLSVPSSELELARELIADFGGGAEEKD